MSERRREGEVQPEWREGGEIIKRLAGTILFYLRVSDVWGRGWTMVLIWKRSERGWLGINLVWNIWSYGEWMWPKLVLAVDFTVLRSPT